MGRRPDPPERATVRLPVSRRFQRRHRYAPSLDLLSACVPGSCSYLCKHDRIVFLCCRRILLPLLVVLLFFWHVGARVIWCFSFLSFSYFAETRRAQCFALTGNYGLREAGVPTARCHPESVREATGTGEHAPARGPSLRQLRLVARRQSCEPAAAQSWLRQGCLQLHLTARGRAQRLVGVGHRVPRFGGCCHAF